MTHDVTLALGVATVSGLLYMALGAWVLTLTPRRRQTLLLAAFTIGFGFRFASGNLAIVFDVIESFGNSTIEWILIPVHLIVMGSALGLAASVPEPMEDRGLIWRSLAIALVLLLPLIVLDAALFPEISWRNKGEFIVQVGSVVPASVLLVLRAHPKRNASPAHVRQWGLLAVAFALLFAVRNGVALTGLAPEFLARGEIAFLLFNLSIIAAASALTLAWGWNMLQADDDTVRIHRAVFLSLLACLTAGALVGAIFPTVVPGDSLLSGTARTLGVGLLAYGILRHDLAGLDEKIQFGVSKTTVAGIFVAVFFIVSEGAQLLFAEFADGNELLGVIAAGLLVFFLAPIQRAADELAERMVPSPARGGTEAAAERYRTAVETALADGEVSGNEERHLGRLAADLGIDADRARELREQVEDEAGGGEAS